MAVQAASLEILKKADVPPAQARAMHSLASSNVRQMYAAMLGQTAVLLGIAYFFVAHLPR
jgi:hypothetical protein